MATDDELDAKGFISKLMSRITRAGTAPQPAGFDCEEDMELEDIDFPNYRRTAPTLTRKELLSDTYKMDYPRRGKAIVINNKNFSYELQKKGYSDRAGTDIDCTTICSRLKVLGFDVDRYHNADCHTIIKAFSQAANQDHSDADCFVGVMLSHGEKDTIYGTDGAIELQEIFQFFKGHNCKSLAGKPKLFFIQACRGQQFDQGVNLNTTDAKRTFDDAFEQNKEIKVPNEADFLLSYSTVPGYYSWRNSTNGSWYIQGLVHVLDKMGTTTEIQKLLTKLNRLVAYSDKYMSNTKDPSMTGMKQVLSFTSMLTKDLYFTPKDN